MIKPEKIAGTPGSEKPCGFIRVVPVGSIFTGHATGTENDWRYRFHIFWAYFLGLCKGISPENMALYGTVPPF